MGIRALVTGADGFIGSHLVEVLLDHGVEVRAFVLYNSFSSLGWLDHLPEEKRKAIEVITGDIRDASRVAEAMKDMDWVFHLAALVSIPYSYHSPASYISVNVNGSLNVLEVAKRSQRQRVLLTSTSEIYGTAQYVPIDEAHPIQAQSPYSASKISAESLATSFWNSFDTPITVVRPFNTYGPRQSARAIIPTIITQLLQGVQELTLGDTSPTRDLTYVTDTCEAMVQILSSDKTIGETINIASQTEISIGELAQKLIDLIQPGTPIIQEERRMRPAKSEVKRLLGSSEKLQELTGWQPKVPFDSGLQQCIDWYSDPKNLSQFNSDQYYV